MLKPIITLPTWHSPPDSPAEVWRRAAAIRAMWSVDEMERRIADDRFKRDAVRVKLQTVRVGGVNP